MKKQGTLLIVDDNRNILTTVRMLLEPIFSQIITIANPNSIPAKLREEKPDVVLLDMNFSSGINSGNEGLYWLREIKSLRPQTEVVLFTAYADIQLAVTGIKEGATDFIVKPFDNEKMIRTLVEARDRNKAVDKLSTKNCGKTSQSAMYWGDSEVMNSLRNIVDKVSKTDANILITGENGTGKEVLANEIHRLSTRSKKSNQEIDSWIKLIRVLTHEIMNTITPVTSLSETLLKELEESESLRIGLETIHKTGTELLSFVNNYRRFTHVPQPQPALFYVEPFLERMAMLCNHEVEISVSPKDLLAYADESLLSHVVTNLLKNAVEAFNGQEKLSTERNKQDGNNQGRNKQECRSADLQSAASKKAFIRLQAYANAQESIIIDVSNNAGLIPEDVASHIFIPFFTTKPEGSGIGLSLSRQIMRVSGGSLSLHQDKAQGITTFRIIIP